jgi:serine/threonine-protein kinase HipA
VLDGRRAHGRYDGSYERIANRIADFVSPGALLKAREQYALMVAYACATENGDAHLKNFSVLYGDPESEVALAPAYDLISTTLYLPRDTLALTLDGSKRFPDRDRMLKFIRSVTGKSERSAAALLDQVFAGVDAAIGKAKAYASRHKDANTFADRLIAAFTRGRDRLAAKRVRGGGASRA